MNAALQSRFDKLAATSFQLSFFPPGWKSRLKGSQGWLPPHSVVSMNAGEVGMRQ